jgi:SnoaL-like domain
MQVSRPNSPQQWVQAFAEGWRAPTGADAFADHFDRLIDDDIRLEQPRIPTLVGREAFRERFARPLFTLIPDVHGRVESWAASGEKLFIEVVVEGTLGGRPVRFRSLDEIQLRDGLAIERRANLDPLPLLGAVATRPRAWPRFMRTQALQLRQRLRNGGRPR